MTRRFWCVWFVLWSTTAAAQTVSLNNTTYLGGYYFTGASFGALNCLTWADSRQTWFGIKNRNNNFDVVEFHMPDDTGTAPLIPTGTQTQANMPQPTLVNDWGTFLSTTNSPAGPLKPTSGGVEVYGCSWDNADARLLVSFGNFYTCQNGENLLGVEFDVFPNVVIYGPWQYTEDGTTALSCTYINQQAMKLPDALLSSNDANLTAARGCAGSAATCNSATTGTNGTKINGQRVLVGSGNINSGNNGAGSQGPNIWTMDMPDMSSAGTATPKDALLMATRMVFWDSYSPTTVTDDLNVVHNIGNLQSSNVKRRDQIRYIISYSSNGSLNAPPDYCSAPYGIYLPPLFNGSYSGWAPGLRADNAYRFLWIDDNINSLTGLMFFGTYSVGASWYGPPDEISNDYTVGAATSCPPSGGGTPATTTSGYVPTNSIWAWPTATGFKSNDGINSANYVASQTHAPDQNGAAIISGRWIKSLAFPVETTNNPNQYVYNRRWGQHGDNSEDTVPAWWVFNDTDVFKGGARTYVNPRYAAPHPWNVDHADFQVLGARSLTVKAQSGGNNPHGCASDPTAIIDLAPWFCSYQYDTLTNPYTGKTQHDYLINGVYYRPSTATNAGGGKQRVYVLTDSAVTSTSQIVNVFTVGSACAATTPLAPSNVAGAPTSSATANITWTDNSNNEDTFTVQACVVVGFGCVSSTYAANSTSTIPPLAGLQPSTSYTATVTATNCAGSATSVASPQFTTPPNPSAGPKNGRLKGVFSTKGDQ